MTLAVRLLVGFTVACAVTYLATPYTIRLANRWQFYDKPVGYKGHARPTPYLGGAAVMAGFLVALLISAGDWKRTAPLAAAAALLWAVGTVDDRRTLSPWLRLTIEFALGVAIWAADLGWDLHAGAALDLVLTCVWVVGVVNAFNLFDNMDGAASTMALVVSGGAALIGVVLGDAWLAAAAGAMCGASLGFLPRNLSLPARIFLGDGGSMPMGFVVAVLVMVAAGTSTVAWHSLLVALLLVGVPALDTCLVIVSRRRRGISVLSGGRDHLTHRTYTYLPNARSVALLLGAIQAAVSVVAVLASRGEASLVVISASLYVLLAGCAILILDTRKVSDFVSANQQPRAARLALSKRAVACLLVVGLGAGLSSFFFTYYDASVWVPIGLGLTIVCAIAFVLRPTRPSGPAALCLLGLGGLGLWSLASTVWAESVESAVVSGNLWLAYAAMLLLMLVLVTHERRAAVLLGAAGVGIAAVALSVLVRLLGSDPASLFVGARLNAPLGYINGEGCLFAMGIWPCMALAQLRRALPAAVGAGMATLMACLALLSQSRGTALAIAGSLLLVLALVPGRTRRAYAALAIAAGVAAAGSELLHVYDHAVGGVVPAGAAHAAGEAALLSSLGVGAAWGLLTAAWQAYAERPGAARARRIATWLWAVPVVVVLAVGVASAHRISNEASKQWRAFVHLAEPGESTTPSASAVSRSRLLSGAGNRYDYWRIALRVWRQHPLIGVGAGNYPRPYFERRSTTEDVQQPHSLALQVLCELGLVGLLLLACLLAGVAWGVARTRRSAARSPLWRGLMTAALGIFAAWAVQGSVDWMHLLPGLTGIALAAVAVMVWQPVPATARAQSPARARVAGMLTRKPALGLGLSAVILTLIIAGASLSRAGLAQLYRSRAQGELAGNPGAALADANRSLGIDADSAQTYYIRAAALARFDQAAAAEASLASALAHEPGNFVTWALLGDISVRERRLGAARRYYARAHELNPRNPTVRELALEPRTALR